MSEWISVDDSLPEEGVKLLLCIEDCGLATGSYYLKHGGCWCIGNDLISWDYEYAFPFDIIVTHWQPLPEPPSDT